MTPTSVSHDRALRFLLAYPGEIDYIKQWTPELPAIITHWLQAGCKPTGFVNREISNRWNSLLSALASSEVTSANAYHYGPKTLQSRKVIIDFDSVPFPPVAKPKFRFIDLFAGIGGFRIALQNLGGQCVFSSEWDKSAKETYYSNFGEVPFGDIRQFTDEQLSDEEIDALIPDHDVLCAGFPCQPFSRAGVSARVAIGKKHGFACETQGTLFFDIIRVAKAKKTAVLFLENVRNLEKHDGGMTFRIIRETIEDELEYSFNYEVLDASSLVPQKRQRVYMVCFRNEKEFSFPLMMSNPLPLRSILEPNPSDKYTISNRLWKGHQERTRRNLDRGTGFTAFLTDLEKPANTLVARYGKDGKECLVPQEGKNPRKLTPRECARLQGFPENFRLPASDAAAYRQFGNSVAVPVVQLVAKNFIGMIF